MKILQVIPYFHPAYAFGGPVKVAYQISRELIKRGHKVVVYTTDAKDFGSRLEIDSNNTIEGMKVHRFRNLSLTLVKKLKLFITPQLALFAREEVKKFDIIHLHEYRTFQNIVIHYYARKYDVPYILQAHGSIPRIGAWQKLKWVYDILFGYRLLRDATRVIALTLTEAEQYMSMGVPKEKITIIPNGIDLSEYAELPPKGSFKKKFNIPEDRKLILYLGRIHKTKGIDFLVKAYAHLIKETNFKDAVLVIAGPDDGYLSEVKSLMHDLSVSNYVLFTGLLSEKDKIKAYTDASIVAYLGPFEPYGLVSLEAAACETPVIVAQVTPMAEIVNRGKFGFSVKYGDVISLASMLHRVLSDKELTENLGRNGRRYVFNNFDWSKITEKYEQVYKEVTNDKR